MAKAKRRTRTATKSKASADALNAADPGQSGESTKDSETSRDAFASDSTGFGTGLVEELQQRCESLRAWHEQSIKAFENRETKISNVTKQLAEGRIQLEAERRKFAAECEALADRVQSCEIREAGLEQQVKDLDTQTEKLERARGEVEDMREQLKQLRSELDGEWASLTRIRRAQESLADALDADRTRLNSETFVLKPTRGKPAAKKAA
jgi:chromosome segregation ATPase